MLSGQTIANIGDTIYVVAIISSIFSWTNSALAASVVPVILTSSKTIGGFLTPVISQRFSLENILKKTQLSKTFLLILLAVYVQSLSARPNIGILYAFVMLIALLDGCADPISLSLVPKYVQAQFLIKANSLVNTMIQLVNIGSWAVGTSLLLWFSVTNLIWLDTGLYLIATLLLFFLPKTAVEKQANHSLRKELVIGWQYVMQQPLLRTVLLLNIFEAVANSVWVSSIILVFVTEFMEKTDNWWGYINATFFFGSLMGSGIVIAKSDWFNKNKFLAIFCGAALSGLVTLGIITWNNGLFILLISIFVGIFSQIKSIPQNTLIQQQTKADKLIYVYSTINIMYTAVFSLAILFMGRLVDIFNVTSAFILSGLLLIIVAFIVLAKRKLFEVLE
ncbi:MFS transporter [Enterococcus sp. HY326]|uniref:MFS transporter n=1 Tax=Enterococcus sp. HY326 TaxID=2971265 RepID=UPI0022407264|nr:MFS transporter [Enterococcus sp. HY326]